MKAFGGSILLIAGGLLILASWALSRFAEDCDGGCPLIIDKLVPVVILGAGCFVSGAVVVAKWWRES